MTKNRILHIIPSLQKGGAERIALDICNELTIRENTEVKLIAFRDDNAYSFLTNSIDYQVIPSFFIPSFSGKNKINVSKLQETIVAFNPSIIHVHLFEAMLVMSAVEYKNTKWFFHFHDNIPQLKKWNFSTFINKPNITNYYERFIFLKVFKNKDVHCIAISNDTLKYIKTNVPIFQAHLLFNAIDRKRFSQIESSRIKGRIINIGSFVEKKGQELAIRTIRTLLDRGQNVSLDLIGDGPLRKDLVSLVEQLNLENDVRFLGKVDFPEKNLNQAEIYLHTAKYEPFGLVLLEAMSAGLPVFCTDGRGNRDLIIDGKNGFMIWERNPDLLAEKIEETLSDKAIYKSMSEYALEFSKQYDIVPYVDNLIDIYSS